MQAGRSRDKAQACRRQNSKVEAQQFEKLRNEKTAREVKQKANQDNRNEVSQGGADRSRMEMRGEELHVFTFYISMKVKSQCSFINDDTKTNFGAMLRDVTPERLCTHRFQLAKKKTLPGLVRGLLTLLDKMSADWAQHSRDTECPR